MLLHLTLASGGEHVCSPSSLPPVKRDSTVFFVGAATADTAVVPVRGRARVLAGQEFLALAIGGAFLQDGGRTSLHDRMRVLLIPWGIGPDCSKIRWRGPARWVRAGLKGFYVAESPKFAPANGSIALDAPNAAYQPYGIRTGDLTPEEYFELYSGTPSADEILRDPVGAAAIIRSWRTENPSIAVQANASAYLNVLEELASRTLRDKS
jgi:hypothetical protein